MGPVWPGSSALRGSDSETIRVGDRRADTQQPSRARSSPAGATAAPPRPGTRMRGAAGPQVRHWLPRPVPSVPSLAAHRSSYPAGWQPEPLKTRTLDSDRGSPRLGRSGFRRRPGAPGPGTSGGRRLCRVMISSIRMPVVRVDCAGPGVRVYGLARLAGGLPSESDSRSGSPAEAGAKPIRSESGRRDQARHRDSIRPAPGRLRGGRGPLLGSEGGLQVSAGRRQRARRR